MKEEDKISIQIDILYSMKENIRRKIFLMIFSSGVEGISFKSIVKNGSIPPTTAAYHLKILNKAGIIEKKFNNLDGRRDYSFYYPTDKGDRAFFMINEIYKDLKIEDDTEKGPQLPDIQVIPLRYGPRCITVEKISG